VGIHTLHRFVRYLRSPVELFVAPLLLAPPLELPPPLLFVLGLLAPAFVLPLLADLSELPPPDDPPEFADDAPEPESELPLSLLAEALSELPSDLDDPSGLEAPEPPGEALRA
jgi:hypothetical protein